MSERVSQFLVSLSQDPVMLDEFLNDPEPFLGRGDFNVEEQDVLRSGDPDRIRMLLGDDGPMLATTSTDPGPPHPKPKPGPPPPPPPPPEPPPPNKPKG